MTLVFALALSFAVVALAGILALAVSRARRALRNDEVYPQLGAVSAEWLREGRYGKDGYDR